MNLYVLFFAHWVGDFVLQGRWMANNKSKSLRALGAHVAVYTATILIACVLLGTGTGSGRSVLAFAGVTGMLHLLTDAITSRITSHLHRRGMMRGFFTTIGFDQYLHFVALVAANRYFLGGA